MRRWLGLPLAVSLVTSLAFAGTAASKLKNELALAAQVDTERGALGVCGVLQQALQMAQQQKANLTALREWDEVSNDCQDAIAKMRSPEAAKIFVKALEGMTPAAQALVALALKDHTPTVEMDGAALKVLQKTKDPAVKVGCVELLGVHAYREGVDAILALLKDTETVGVQVACCRALAVLQERGAVPALIAYLKSLKGGRMRFEATAALRALTGQDFGAGAATWDGWWQKNAETFVLPEPRKPEFNYELKANPKEDLAYYEIPVVENRIVFAFDNSGSMAWGGKPNRLERNRLELKELVKRLDDKTAFNVILFSGGARRWQKAPLVPATAAHKKDALAFLDRAQPGGATMTMTALEEALWECTYPPGVETIYLLTDGAPTPMSHTPVVKKEDFAASSDAIRRRIRFINQTLKVRIHTIGVYTTSLTDPAKPPGVLEPDPDVMKAFLENVAADNDGVYKEVK
jgi:hypothetical protein